MRHIGPLIVLCSSPARRWGHRVRVSRKLVTGLERYARGYGGAVEAILPLGDDATSLDAIDVDLESAPFDIHTLPFDSRELRARCQRAGVVLGGPDHRLFDLPPMLEERGVPYVLCTEYTLRTRLEIVRAEVRNPLRAARRVAWEIGQELRTRRALRHAAAVQCNGVPTFDAYAHLAPEAILYFDNRVEASMVPSPRAVRARAEGGADGPIRLVYSGRLHPMKGVGALPDVAAGLVARGVAFELDVFGDGPLREPLAARIRKLGLERRVTLRGVADFESELVPWVRDHADLFVCCHPQGDPACTYVETLACGVPVVGYDNEALAGILRKAPRVGAVVPTGDVAAMAATIERYARDRALLVDQSIEALAFASRHLFEETFARRAEQLERLALEAERRAAFAASRYTLRVPAE